MTRLRAPLLLVLALLAVSSGWAQPGAADSLALQQSRVQAMRDSLALGVRLFTGWSNLAEREPTDSLRLAVQEGPGLAWREWALNQAPRRGMSGKDILTLADLHGLLANLDLEGCYNEKLECIKRAMRMPDTEVEALARLHDEYLGVGFPPGMQQTGMLLLQKDPELALRKNVSYSMALANYIVGDKKEAERWVKRQLREHPEDSRARELKRRIKKMRPMEK